LFIHNSIELAKILSHSLAQDSQREGEDLLVSNEPLRARRRNSDYLERTNSEKLTPDGLHEIDNAASKIKVEGALGIRKNWRK
jgi:hypothetical protein